VEAFNEAVGLGVIGSGGMMGNVEKGAEGGPEVGSELGATVRSDVGGDAVVGDPVVDEGLCVVGSHGGF
jgi:hypothetical protein